MVRCTECGEDNPVEAQFCVNCGVELYPSRRRRSERRRHGDEICFGVPISRQMWGIIFGLAIVIWGISSLMDWSINFFAIIAIALGSVILMSALRISYSR